MWAIAIPKPGRVGYELLKFSTPDIALPDTTLDSLWSCAKEYYGITALTAVTGVGGIPISKLTLGHGIWLGAGKKTNLISHYGLKFFPMAKLPPATIAQMAKSTFGTIRIFGIVGRASPYVALGLAVYDVVSIGLCAYKEKMAGERTKDEIFEKSIDIFIDATGFIDRKKIHLSTNPAIDLKIHTDDLTLFILQIEKYFDMKPTPEEWLKVGTFEQLAEFVELNRGIKKPRKPIAFWRRLFGLYS